MITINAKTFADALTLVAGAIERRSTIPILQNVRIDGDWRRGTLTLQCTDLETALSVTIPAGIVSEIHLTVPARELLAFVKTIDKGETVSLRAIASGLRVFVGDGISAEFASMSIDNFPELPAAPSPSAMIPGAVLADALRKTTFSVASEESRYTLIGSLFEIQGEALTVVSTDGHRLSHYKAAGDVASTADFRGMIPKAALLLAEKMLKRSKGKAEAQVSRDENHAYFRIGDALLTVRLLSGQFPDYERVLQHCKGEITATVDRRQFAAALKQVARFADERSRAVRMSVNGSLELAASGSDVGSGKVSIPVQHFGADLERIGFNAEYLMHGLAATERERSTLWLDDEESAGVLRETSASTDWRYVVMPMRV